MEPEQEFHYVKINKELLEEGNQNNLKQRMGFFLIFILALNFIFDSSIFFIPQMAVVLSGPASIISWILLTFIAIYVAMCFAEIISMIPTSGGIYEISKRTYGSFISFLTGWITWMGGNFALFAAVTAGLEVLIISQTTLSYIAKMFIGIGTVLLFSYLALKSKDIDSKIIAYSTILILVVFGVMVFSTYIDVGALLSEHTIKSTIDITNYHPFFKQDGFFSNFGLILGTIFIIATTFFGLEAVSFLSGEVKNPKEVMPKVIIYPMIIVAVVMLVFVVASIGVIDTETYSTSTFFFKDIMETSFGGYGTLIIAFVVILSGILYFTEGFAWLLSGPRLIYAIAKDDLFPSSFRVIDQRYDAPVKAIKFQAIFLSIGIIFNYLIYIFTDEDPFYIFHEQLVFTSLTLIIILLITVPILRKKLPDMERPYTVPFGNILPYLIAVFFFIVIICWIIFDNGFRALLIQMITISIGIPIYMFLLFFFDPEVFIKFKKTFAYFGMLYEFIFFRKDVKEAILDKSGDLEGKRVLMFGCGFGSITSHIAEKVGHEGKLFITDISHKTAKIVHKKAQKKGHHHVSVLHDEHHANRVHPAVPEVDTIISIGLLHHIQDLEKILKEMYIRLPEGGRIVFKDEVDILKILPNGGWAADPDKIIRTLKKEGFIVQKHIKKGFLLNHLIIYAMKSKDDVPFL